MVADSILGVKRIELEHIIAILIIVHAHTRCCHDPTMSVG